jgi:hypothetical protein
MLSRYIKITRVEGYSALLAYPPLSCHIEAHINKKFGKDTKMGGART